MEYVLIALIFLMFIIFFRMIRIVPQQSAWIVERLGKYHSTLDAGFHILVPFIDDVRYKLTLKEDARMVRPQTCITKDNVTVDVDGILYIQVIDPVKAVYGINDYLNASMLLAQTTMRSVIGRLELDKTFEERDMINSAIVSAVDAASEPWGVKVTRYEVRDIIPPPSIRDAMEAQMRAEREKRANIATSEGIRQSKINTAEGVKQEAILQSEGAKMKLINEAEGQGQQIERVARATANGIREIASAVLVDGGTTALNLQIARQYIEQFGNLAKTNNTIILPSNLADVSSFIAAAMSVVKNVDKK